MDKAGQPLLCPAGIGLSLWLWLWLWLYVVNLVTTTTRTFVHFTRSYVINLLRYGKLDKHARVRSLAHLSRLYRCKGDGQGQIKVYLAKVACPIALDIEHPTIYPWLPKKLLQFNSVIKATILTRVHNLIPHITPLCLTIASSVSASFSLSRICIIVRYTNLA